MLDPLQDSSSAAEVAHFMVMFGVWLVKMASKDSRQF